MLIPIFALIVFSILAMLYNGGFWGMTPLTILSAQPSATVPLRRLWSWVDLPLWLLRFFCLFPARLSPFRDFMGGITTGVKSMVPAFIILTLAWTISGVCRDLLMTGDFVKDMLAGSALPPALLPAIVFVVAALLSFAMGTAWGTFGILIPIVVPTCVAIAPQLLVVTLSATLAGSVFGDHCSPFLTPRFCLLPARVATIFNMSQLSCRTVLQLPVAALSVIWLLV